MQGGIHYVIFIMSVSPHVSSSHNFMYLCIWTFVFLAWGYGEHEIIFLHFRIVISLESRKNLELLEVCLFWNMDSIWLILSRWNGGFSVIGSVLMVPLCEYHIQHPWTKLLLLVGEPVVINNSLALDSPSYSVCWERWGVPVGGFWYFGLILNYRQCSNFR